MESNISHEAAAEVVEGLPEWHRRRIAAMRDQTTTAAVTLYMPDVLDARGIADLVYRVRDSQQQRWQDVQQGLLTPKSK